MLLCPECTDKTPFTALNPKAAVECCSYEMEQIRKRKSVAPTADHTAEEL